MLHHFQGRDFLKLADFTPEEVGYLVDTAIELKRKRAMGELFEPLRGKTIAMIFEKLSTRTRVSFQAGAAQLGAQTFYMSPDQMQTSRGEPIRDTARIIDRYCDALFIRTFGQEIVEEFAALHAQPGHQRPHQRDAPLPGALRPDDDQGEEGRLQGSQDRLPRRHLERLPLADDGQRHDGHGLLRGAAQRELPAQRRAAAPRRRSGRRSAARRSSTRGTSKRSPATPTSSTATPGTPWRRRTPSSASRTSPPTR